MSVSLQVIGCLGGATRQAVSKSGNPRKWLDARIRRALVPEGNKSWSYFVGAIPARAREHAVDVIDHAGLRLESLTSTGKGRPVKRSPLELAQWLGVKPRVNDTLHSVFARYIKRQLKALVEHYRRTPKGQRWFKLRRALDSWMPRWVNRSSKAPPSWKLCLDAKAR